MNNADSATIDVELKSGAAAAGKSNPMMSKTMGAFQTNTTVGSNPLAQTGFGAPGANLMGPAAIPPPSALPPMGGQQPVMTAEQMQFFMQQQQMMM